MFLQWALPRIGFRWDGFRRVRRQVCRRIDARRQALGLADIAGYKAYVETHPAEFTVLDGFCRITISRFYRDRAVFDHLRDMILPMLARAAGARPARAWCIGCASGEEPYSLRLAWRLGPAAAGGGGLHIIATDTEPRVLERAQRACYGHGSLKELPESWIDRAFAREGALYCLREPFRRDIDFAQQDVRAESPPGPFDLVMCRNLAFTYFDAPARERVMDRIAANLSAGGVLVIGRGETLPTPAAGFGVLAPDLGIYRRLDDGANAEHIGAEEHDQSSRQWN